MLDEIVEWKKTEVEERKLEISRVGAEGTSEDGKLLLRTKEILLNAEKPLAPTRRFEQALLLPAEAGRIAVISEIKRCSPSAGDLAVIADPVDLATKYEMGGAAAISCLTDQKFFKGSIRDLMAVASAVKLPVLRKDFVIDEVQIAEAKAAGASAVLLIVAVVGRNLSVFLESCQRMDIEALVEVHDADELQIAVECGARIVGVNSRNLKTFVTDLKTAEDLAPSLSSAVVKVGESGIKSEEDVSRLQKAGYQAVLVGEALVSTGDPISRIQQFSLAKV